MNCANHPDVLATAYCRTCGRGLCQGCQRPALGTIFCEEHIPVQSAAGAPPAATAYSPYTTPYVAPSPGGSPGLAFVLGLIPGVGAIYNGQYGKGLIHVVVLGLLVSMVSSDAVEPFQPLFVFLIVLWFFYMAFEAYHTAAKRLRGEPVEEFSSLLPAGRHGGFPAGPLVLIFLGVIFLLNTMEIVRLHQIMRYWPVLLIAMGVYMLVARATDARRESTSSNETRHE